MHIACCCSYHHHVLNMSKLLYWTVIALVVTMVASRSAYRDNEGHPSLDNPSYANADLEPAASGHHGHGRVHIKVYRGPSDGHHAPHGFWVKQPADDDRH